MLSTWELLDRKPVRQILFTEKKFNRYRQSDNFKVPFWLQPEKYYTGVAWYQRDIDIPCRVARESHSSVFRKVPLGKVVYG